MRCAKIVIVFLFLFEVTSHAAGSEGCLPGWNQTMDRFRAVERAYGCSKSVGLEDCKLQMGLGTLAVFAASKTVGKNLMSKVGQAIRDRQYRPCPIAFNHPLDFLVAKAWAADCISPDLIKQAELKNTLQLMEEEGQRVLAAQKAILESQKAALATQPMNAEQVAAEYKKSVGEAKTSLGKAEKMAEEAYQDFLRKNYSDVVHADARALREFESTWDAYRREFKTTYKFLNANWVPEDMDIDYFVNNREKLAQQLVRDGASPERVRQLTGYVDSIRQADGNLDAAYRAQAAMQHNPRYRQLKNQWDEAKQARVQFKPPPQPPAPVPRTEQQTQVLKKTIEQMESDLKILANRQTELQILNTAAKSPMDKAEIKAVSEKLATFIPKETLTHPSQGAVLQAIENMEKIGQSIVAKVGAFKSVGLTRFSILNEASWQTFKTAALRAGTATAGMAVAGFASAGELAAYTGAAGDENCGDMTTSTLYARDKNKSCKQNLTMDNPLNQKFAEMDPDELCLIAKQKPEIIEMIEENYRHYYPQVRSGGCTQPIKISFSTGEQITYGQGRMTYLNKPKAAIEVFYGPRGNEVRTEVMRTRRSGGYEKIAWGAKAQDTEEEYNKFATLYKEHIMPTLAEMTSCCAGQGVVPEVGDCARYGVKSPTGSSSQPGVTY